ncbi:antitoxin [Nocardia sp. BMG51109]|uniref:antitoxin n=1 Tax=Nocardia sp. BMG51109 TaxID=1056816 RepID=UPI000463F574|nr:antitoxin [Nocardia sp. BMG51109]
MGMFNFKKIADLAGKHADKFEPVIDKVGDAVDKQTKGKYAKQVDKAQQTAKKTLREQRHK